LLEARNPVSRSGASSESTELAESKKFEPPLNDLPVSTSFCLNEEEEAISQVQDPPYFHSDKNHAEESTIDSRQSPELIPKIAYVGASQAKAPPRKEKSAQACAKDVANKPSLSLLLLATMGSTTIKWRPLYSREP
jgi:hypothetical protein